MREYLDSIFQKAKKPLTIDEIYHAVENKIKGKYLDGSFTAAEKKKVLEALDFGVKDYDYYETPDKKYMLLSKSPYRVGKYYAKSNPIERVALVANYFELMHPYTKKVYKFEVGIPKSFEKIVK